MKKLFVLLLAAIMVLGMVACAKTPAETTPSTTTKPAGGDDTTTTTTEPEVKVEFPLKEEITLVLTTGIRNTVIDLQKNLAQNKLWQDAYKATNVRIEIRTCTGIDSLTAMMQTGDYGDIIITQDYNESVLSDLISTGKLLELDEYVSNRGIMPNLNSRVFDELPEAKGSFTSPNGHLYVLGTYDWDKSGYLESSCWINKTWLDKANMKVEDLATLEGLEKFFDWIMKNDPNGNGEQDELPYYCYPMGGGMIEALLGMWGLPTKDGTNENYVVVNDGVVEFVPQTDAYKEFLSVMNKWWNNGWMYKDYVLGHNNDNYAHAMDTYIRENGNPERVGFYTGTGPNARNKNADNSIPETCEYISIVPPTVEGYETRWFFHPGYLGSKGCFAIASNCEYPEVALAWMDMFYSQEYTARFAYGEEGTDWVSKDKDGKLIANTLTNDKQAEILETEDNRLNQILAVMPVAYTKADWENVYAVTDAVQATRDALATYEPFINTEVWPRPYIDVDDSKELSEIRGDIMLCVEEYRAKAIKGDANLTTDWEKFQSDLEKVDTERLVEIMQTAYDTWKNGQE